MTAKRRRSVVRRTQIRRHADGASIAVGEVMVVGGEGGTVAVIGIGRVQPAGGEDVFAVNPNAIGNVPKNV